MISNNILLLSNRTPYERGRKRTESFLIVIRKKRY